VLRTADRCSPFRVGRPEIAVRLGHGLNAGGRSSSVYGISTSAVQIKTEVDFENRSSTATASWANFPKLITHVLPFPQQQKSERAIPFRSESTKVHAAATINTKIARVMMRFRSVFLSCHCSLS
jgi:hypothetical protein